MTRPGVLRLARRVSAAQASMDGQSLPPLAALARVYPRYGRAYPVADPVPPDCVDLGIGAYFDPPPEAVQAARDALERGYTRYLDLPDLRQAITAKLREDNGIEADPDRGILVVGGARTGIVLACLALVEEGDDVLLFDPDYIGMAHCARLAGGRIVPVPLETTPAARALDADALARSVTPATRLLMLTNPNNPTGHLYSAAELDAIATVAQRHDLVVLSNELYDGLVYSGGRHVSLATRPGMAERTVTIQGVSKVLDMTGFRIGWLTGPEGLLAHLTDLRFVAALALPPSASQFAAAAALAPHVRRRHQRRSWPDTRRTGGATIAALDGYLGVRCPPPTRRALRLPRREGDLGATTSPSPSSCAAGPACRQCRAPCGAGRVEAIFG